MRTPLHRRSPVATVAALTLLLTAGCTTGDADPQAAPAVTASDPEVPAPDGQAGGGDGSSDAADEGGSVTASEPFAAVPAGGTEPGGQLDIGGPGLSETCASGGIPIPVDATNVSCTEHDGQPVAPDAEWGGSVDDRLEPGTYWAVLVCDGVESVEIRFDTAPGLPSTTTEIPCADDGQAARVELGTVETEATSDWGVRATGTVPGTFLFYLVLEGQTA